MCISKVETKGGYHRHKTLVSLIITKCFMSLSFDTSLSDMKFKPMTLYKLPKSFPTCPLLVALLYVSLCCLLRVSTFYIVQIIFT